MLTTAPTRRGGGLRPGLQRESLIMTTKNSQRRKALQLMGAASMAALTVREARSGGSLLYGAAAAACKADVESTAGPYPNINPLERSDIRGNTAGNAAPKPGAPLTLRLRVLDLDNGCAPIPGAVVDIWSCDAKGLYASYSPFGTQGQDFCRGYQKTDANGQVEFLTLFPGSYSGRALHIHFAIQSAARNIRPNDDGRNLPSVFVAQLYFTAATADEVFRSFPLYQQGAPRTRNEADGIYASDGGSGYLVQVSKSGNAYTGVIDVGVRRSAIGMGTVQPDTPLSSGQAVAVNLGLRQTRLYSVQVPAGRSRLTFRLSGGSGDGDIYSRLATPPTTSSYERKSDGSSNAELITYNSPPAGKYYLLLSAYAAVSGASLVATVT